MSKKIRISKNSLSLALMLVLTGLVMILKTPIKTITNPPSPEVLGQYTSTSPAKETLEQSVVVKVSDGDTIKLENDMTIRFLNIDTPELSHPQSKIREECYGRDATERMKQLALGKTVFLESDKRKKDKYSRDLRYVYIRDELTSELISLNEYMVGEGFARAYILSPNIKHKEKILALQARAREEKRGLWGACDVTKFRW